MKKISITMILSIFWSFPAYSLKIDPDIMTFAREKREEVKKDTAEIRTFTEKSFWDRHKWKTAGAGIAIIIFYSWNYNSCCWRLMGASLVSATSGAGVPGGVVRSCLDEDGSLHIPV